MNSWCIFWLYSCLFTSEVLKARVQSPKQTIRILQFQRFFDLKSMLLISNFHYNFDLSQQWNTNFRLLCLLNLHRLHCNPLTCTLNTLDISHARSWKTSFTLKLNWENNNTLLLSLRFKDTKQWLPDKCSCNKRGKSRKRFKNSRRLR